MESDQKKFVLNLNNIKDIDYTKYEKNFRFIVNERIYSVPRIVADILSPKIRRLHLTDETIDEFHIHTSHNDDKYFSEFIELCNFNDIDLDEERRERYSTYFLQIGNISEYIELQKPNIESLSTKEAIEYIAYQEQILTEHSEDVDRLTDNTQEIISFISKHFSELSIEDLFKLSQETVYEIITNSSLLISDEDSLLDIVIELYKKDETYSKLFSTILFSNLKYESIEKFIKTFSIDDMSKTIWGAISDFILNLKRRYPESYDQQCQSRYIDVSKLFKIEKGNEFDGIMRYLTNKTGGNIHDNGTIEITSNSFCNGHHPKNSVDYDNSTFYASVNDSTLAHICFDFKDNRIQLSNYSIKSYNRSQNYEHLRSWVVEVSNDGEEFKEIDSHSDDPTLNNSNSVGTFNISKGSNKFYRYIRIRQTNYSWYGYPNNNNHQYYIQFIEFFGKLKEKTK